MNKYTVRWADKTGQEFSKEYDDYKVAKDACKWLTERGAEWTDIAIKVKEKPPIES